MVHLVPLVFLCLVGIVCTKSVDDYIVSLFTPSESTEVQTHLHDHISEVDSMLQGCSIIHVYWQLAQVNFLAYSITLKDEEVEVVRNMPAVKFVDPVGHMNVAARSLVSTVPFDPQYIRPEVSSLARDGFCDMTYRTYDDFVNNYEDRGLSDIDVFVLDTGIQASHAEFEGRVEHGIDLVSEDFPIKSDPHGHGTQVAGIIGGRKLGSAKRVRLVDVRVMDENGRGRVDDILAGLDFVVARYLEAKESKGVLTSVACMSMIGPQSKALRYALFYISKAVLVVTSMGDTDSFSCLYSPMDSPYALSVGGLERTSELNLPGSNFGDCVDIYAPGEDLPAPFIGESNQEVQLLSGSSASAAFVTGVVAHIMSNVRSPALVYPKTGRTVYEEMLNLLQEGQHVSFVRNILLGSREDIQLKGVANNNIKQVHSMKGIECDLRGFADIMRLCFGQLQLMERKTDRPKAFQKVKSNLAEHARKKAEEFYAS